ncbi:MAG: OmpA family protein [Bacteroidota bacterium]
MPSLFLAVLFLSNFSTASAQEETIFLTNPSFEDIPRHSTAPRGWIDCGFNGESAVDIHPTGTFSVVKRPQNGNTYLGMVVRDNDTWESVSQPLSTPMMAGNCYEFSIFLSRSETYISVSKLTDERANYNTAAKLRIYGGLEGCKRGAMLAETNLIIHTRWIEYNFKFEPKENFSHIIFEAFYNTPTLFPYNGNLLLDNASSLKLIPCEEQEIAEEEPPADTPSTQPVVTQVPTPQPQTPIVPEPQTQPAPPVMTPTTTPAVSTPTPEPEESKVIESAFNEIKREEIKEGTIIRTNQVYFAADKSDINTKSFETLNQLYEFLKGNPDVRIEIGGHTNGLPPDDYCDNLSTNRAKAVVDYLKRKGINSNRLEYRGYGKRNRIASDDTIEGRRKNQRVEIKILAMSKG